MGKLQKAIEDITFSSKRFPKEAFEVIAAHKEEAIPYLRSAIEKSIEERDELDKNYQLHFYALYLLGEFQDREFFTKLIEFVALPSETLDYLIGDAVASGLKDILYNTYNGDIELIKNTIADEYVDEFVRSALLEVMGQLYLDGTIEEDDWKAFLKQNIYSGQEYSYLYNGLAAVICECHFVDMLPEIRYMLDNDLMDEMCLGKYDSCVDKMFGYQAFWEGFCDPTINAADMLKGWAMFEEDKKSEGGEKDKKDFEKLIKALQKQTEPSPMRKIGRNDACPCGSGKKYKFCCLNKPKDPIDMIESPQERKKWLERYPYIGTERHEGRVYLDEYYDAESIEIDKLLYLGLMNRLGFIWNRDEFQEQKRCREYLKLAFGKFREKVAAEGIKNFTEYDQKFSIHYFSKEWLGELMDLLKKDNDKILYREVQKFCKGMVD